jgi:hypothetical protein
VTTVPRHAHGVCVLDSQQELEPYLAFSEGDGQNCGKKSRGISGTATPYSTRTDYERDGCLGLGDDKLEDEA